MAPCSNRNTTMQKVPLTCARIPLDTFYVVRNISGIFPQADIKCSTSICEIKGWNVWFFGKKACSWAPAFTPPPPLSVVSSCRKTLKYSPVKVKLLSPPHYHMRFNTFGLELRGWMSYSGCLLPFPIHQIDRRGWEAFFKSTTAAYHIFYKAANSLTRVPRHQKSCHVRSALSCALCGLVGSLEDLDLKNVNRQRMQCRSAHHSFNL